MLAINPNLNPNANPNLTDWSVDRACAIGQWCRLVDSA